MTWMEVLRCAVACDAKAEVPEVNAKCLRLNAAHLEKAAAVCSQVEGPENA